MSSGNPPDPTGGNPSPSLPDSPSNEPTQPPSEPTQPPPPTTPSPPSPTVPPPNPRPPPPPPPPEPSQPQPPRPTTSSTPRPPSPGPPPPATTPPPETPSPPPPAPTTNPGNRSTVTITSTASNAPPAGTEAPNSTNSGLPSVGPHPRPSNSGSGSLSTSATIALAVIVPISSVTLIILVLLWWWRKRKARKMAEEERKQEIEEYRFNPNNDPLLPAVGNFDDGNGLKDGNTGGYRGWGTTTSTSRKLSTNLSSGAGIPASDNGSNPGPPRAVSPVDDSIPYEDDQRPISGDYSGLDPVAAGMLGHNANSHDIVHRGPSNASSAYSNANRSDISDDIPVPGVAPGTAQYYDDPYYTDGAGQPGGPFVDNPYGAPPVIRDVQARRNTRIENPSVFPQQGNAGIAQNF
ncbi:uncharacterized protein BDCG_00326 [Blastomyces dermatitidis ER-3]|uniref:Uncharacterized protein n=1 Tax=Ajellomyces dermatitidis (strain ER-3 / ATCC MYA-2586) TaxID=559297 RepID=A0ABM9YF85_AJEDR|nr:uncharacterized protein BDCG_00326 [Blastomyces dermatitidis ER-3]EEQ83521.1 hypothetical protein BDCG_00326 [Blastomyces dermatitidis ER-3]